MTHEQVLKLLVETEHQLERRKQNALVRAQWPKVIGIEAQIELCEQLRKEITFETAAVISEKPFVRGYVEGETK